MSKTQISQLPDPDMQAAPAALARAAERARELARQTGAAGAAMRDGTLADGAPPREGPGDNAAAAWVENWRGCLAGRDEAGVDDERVRYLLNKHLR